MNTYVKFFALTLLSAGISINADIDDHYQSQYGQDKYFNENFFKNKKGGVFIDIGAHDGKSLSNTWFFEKTLDWQGICFEPMPAVYDLLVRNRKCICIKGAVSETKGLKEFRQNHGPSTEMLSGLQSKYDPRHVQRIEAENAAYGGSSEIIMVNCYLLNDILEKYHFDYVDFLSIDTEGGELDILKSIDFTKVYIYGITVENNYDSTEIREFLESKGFRFVETIHIDEVYINTAICKKKN